MMSDSLSRRYALASAGLALGTPAAASVSGARDQHALARVLGAQRQTWFDGRLAMVAGTGHAMPAFGLRGVIETRITRGATPVIHRLWSGSFTTLNGEPLLDRARNPVTGQWLSVPSIAGATSFSATDADIELLMRDDGPFVTFDFSERGPPALAPQVRHALTALRAQIEDTTRAAVAAHGIWRATGPWPGWLAMGDAPGSVAIEGRIAAAEIPAV